MLSGVVTDQRMKAQGNHVPNGPKDGIAEQHEQELDVWRTQTHQGYSTAMSSTMSDPYMSSYYGGTYPYQAFGVSDGTWSNGGDPMTYLSGYGQQIGHDYNIDGMFGPGGFGGFGQPSFGYSFPGSGDYTWGSSNINRNKHYEDYYRDNNMYGHDERNGMKPVEQGMHGLSIGTDGKKDVKVDGISGKGDGSHKDNVNSVQSQKKPTWANIASQPAKPQSKLKKSIPPAPMLPGGKHMDIGTWDGKNSTKPIPPPPAPRPSWGSRGYGPQPHVQPAQPASSQPTGAAAPPSQPHPVLEELKVRNDYNPKEFNLTNENTRFFVIKSYSEDDIHRSIKYEIWCSTEHGNKRLDQAFRDSKGPIYLFFSVNSSGHFCGMAQMMSQVDYNSSSSVWAQKKWKGQFKVKWVYVKDVPNVQLRQIRLENNENKPVTNSRDTQEILYEKGKQVLKILQTYKHTTSIFDDFIHYEKRQEEEEMRRQQQQQPPPPTGGQQQQQQQAPPPAPKEESRGRGRGNRN